MSGDMRIPEKMRRLIEFLESKGIPYEYDPPYAEGEPHIVRVYFTDVLEAMGIEWRGLWWEDICDVFSELAYEIRGHTDYVGDDEDEWEEQSDRWLFYAW